MTEPRNSIYKINLNEQGNRRGYLLLNLPKVIKLEVKDKI